MLSVTVKLLPREEEGELKSLYEELVQALRQVPEMADERECAIVVHFPPDQMLHGLGEEIAVEARFEEPSDNILFRNVRTGFYADLAGVIGRALMSRYPAAWIISNVALFSGVRRGHWSSKRPDSVQMI